MNFPLIQSEPSRFVSDVIERCMKELKGNCTAHGNYYITSHGFRTEVNKSAYDAIREFLGNKKEIIHHGVIFTLVDKDGQYFIKLQYAYPSTENQHTPSTHIIGQMCELFIQTHQPNTKPQSSVIILTIRGRAGANCPQ